jgi:DNA replication protein DnaC
MINQSTIDSLKAMKLTAMATELQRQIEDSSTYGMLGFEERIGLLVDAEWNRHQANKLAGYIKNAHFSAPNTTIEGIECHEERKLDKAQILRFSTCRYILEGHHIILKVASSNGKTYIASALGHEAGRKFKSVCRNFWMN